MNRLQGKDLINIGIFTAIYFIVIFAAASIGFIPIFHPPAAVLLLQKKFAAIWAAFPLYAQNSIAVFQDTFHHVAQQIFPLSQQND